MAKSRSLHRLTRRHNSNALLTDKDAYILAYFDGNLLGGNLLIVLAT